MHPCDNLELLLPNVAPTRLERARKLTTMLRLLTDDARRAPASSVRANLDRARGELELHTRTRLREGVVDLLRRHLLADVGVDSFAWYGELQSTASCAWSVIEEYRDELTWLPHVPEPNETAAAVAERLLATLERLGVTPREVDLWRARVLRANSGPECGEAAFRELLDAALRAARAPDARVLCGAVECLLDRGAVRAARHLLDEHAAWSSNNERVARLRSWTVLLQEDENGARSAVVGHGAWRGRIPQSLVELRGRRSAWLPLLAGVAPQPALACAGTSERSVSRKAVGALVLAVFALREVGRHEYLDGDIAPGLRERMPDWLRGLDGACSEPSSPEHCAVVEARVAIVHRSAPGELRSAVSAAHVQALAVVPIVDDAGEVAGWLRLEWDHHLVPSVRALERLAFAWRERVLAQRANDQASSASHAPHSGSSDIEWATPAVEGACAEVLRALVSEVGMKTAQRRWWGFEVSGTTCRLAAEGGSALGEGELGGSRALRRALRSGSVVQFDEPDCELSIRRDAASGVVLPLLVRGELCGLLAVESARRKDFPAALTARWTERVRWNALDLRVARFREWHSLVFDHDVHFASHTAQSATWVEQVLAAAASDSACTLIGPSGSGKHVVARWLHFERGAAPRFESFTCGDDERALWGAGADDEPMLRRALGGTLVLEDIERLSVAGQTRLLSALERQAAQPARSVRWVVTSKLALERSIAAGTLREDLGRRLERLQIRVPALDERRPELLRIVALLTRRFAREEGVPPPRFDDEALAMLWRQPWRANLRELENLVFKLVLFHAGQDVQVEHVEALARRHGLELLPRVSSRSPDAELVRAALASTANLRGTINKTRAALYLGWDPDTLVSRMTELGLAVGRVDLAGLTTTQRSTSELPSAPKDAASSDDVR